MSKKRLFPSSTSIAVIFIFASVCLGVCTTAASVFAVGIQEKSARQLPTVCAGINCSLLNSGSWSTFTVEGTLHRPDATTYQYGSYTLVDESGNIYALQNHGFDLGQYIGKKVNITGTLIPGYPVDGGPPYLDVECVSYKLEKVGTPLSLSPPMSRRVATQPQL